MFMWELSCSLSREVLSSTSSVSQGSSGDIILFCRVALRASSTPGFGRLTQGSQQQSRRIWILCFWQKTLSWAASGSKPAVGIPVAEHLTLALLLGVCASSSSLFPLQLLLVFVPRESRSRNALPILSSPSYSTIPGFMNNLRCKEKSPENSMM